MDVDALVTGLGPAGEAAVRAVEAVYDLEDFQLPILRGYAVQLDRAANFAAIIERDGPIFVDRFGQQKMHPAVDGERKALDAARLLLRELGLEVEEEPGRPPRLARRY